MHAGPASVKEEHHTSTIMRILSLLLVGLTACAAGYSIRTVSQSPASVSIRYDTDDSREYPAAIKRAETLCQTYGKHARQAAAPVPVGEGRAVATFDCVP